MLTELVDFQQLKELLDLFVSLLPRHSRSQSPNERRNRLTRARIHIERKTSSTPGQLTGLPAQIAAQYGATPYSMGSPAGPGTPLGAPTGRGRGAPSRLQNVAYGAPGSSPQLGQLGQNGQSNLALLAQQQQQQQHQMQQHQMRLAVQAQALAAQQAANQHQQLQQFQHQQQLAQQQQNNKRKRQEEQSPAPTIEEENGEAEDLTPYCFCHRPSFGEVRL